MIHVSLSILSDWKLAEPRSQFSRLQLLMPFGYSPVGAEAQSGKRLIVELSMEQGQGNLAPGGLDKKSMEIPTCHHSGLYSSEKLGENEFHDLRWCHSCILQILSVSVYVYYNSTMGGAVSSSGIEYAVFLQTRINWCQLMHLTIHLKRHTQVLQPVLPLRSHTMSLSDVVQVTLSNFFRCLRCSCGTIPVSYQSAPNGSVGHQLFSEVSWIRSLEWRSMCRLLLHLTKFVGKMLDLDSKIPTQDPSIGARGVKRRGGTIRAHLWHKCI